MASIKTFHHSINAHHYDCVRVWPFTRTETPAPTRFSGRRPCGNNPERSESVSFHHFTRSHTYTRERMCARAHVCMCACVSLNLMAMMEGDSRDYYYYYYF